MTYYIAGLGNPGEEYEGTRHNTGRIVLENIVKKFEFEDFKENPKSKSLVSNGSIGKEKVILIEPNNFMNKSGPSIANLVGFGHPMSKNQKGLPNLIVIHDDLDIPLGKIKVSFNKSAGGHRGVESIIKAIKTQAFIRIRVGISTVTAGGKLKKPVGEEAVTKHIIGPFKKPELDILKKVAKIATDAVEMIVSEGVDKAMGEFNSR